MKYVRQKIVMNKKKGKGKKKKSKSLNIGNIMARERTTKIKLIIITN